MIGLGAEASHAVEVTPRQCNAGWTAVFDAIKALRPNATAPLSHVRTKNPGHVVDNWGSCRLRHSLPNGQPLKIRWYATDLEAALNGAGFPERVTVEISLPRAPDAAQPSDIRSVWITFDYRHSAQTFQVAPMIVSFEGGDEIEVSLTWHTVDLSSTESLAFSLGMARLKEIDFGAGVRTGLLGELASQEGVRLVLEALLNVLSTPNSAVLAKAMAGQGGGYGLHVRGEPGFGLFYVVYLLGGLTLRDTEHDRADLRQALTLLLSDAEIVMGHVPLR